MNRRNFVVEVETDKDWTVGRLIELDKESSLRVNPEYQRGLRWKSFQKKMFIDSILRGYSIPAFYLHKTVTQYSGNTFWDIVDGQQRIDAIKSYCEDAFELLDPSDDAEFRFPNFAKDTSCEWGGSRFSDLSDELQKKLREHKVVVFEITTENDNSIRDLFIRLQGGVPLTSQDKRDSWPGNFTDFVLVAGGKSGKDRWYGWPLFLEIAKMSNESRRRQFVAQAFMLFWMVRNEKRFCDIKSLNIDEFYHSQVDFDEKSEDAKQFKRVCDKLAGVFRGKPRLVGHYLIHLILFADLLIKEYAPGWENELTAKLHEFDICRNKAAEEMKNHGDSELRLFYLNYGRLTQTQSDNASTIRQRHAFFVDEMLKLLDPKMLDPQRSFSDLQRQIVFFRDKEICQWCRMNGNNNRVSWDECDIHHVEPHAVGGKTHLRNAALVHRNCHPKGEENVPRFRDWWDEVGLSVRDESAARQRKQKDRKLPPDGTMAKFEFGDMMYLGEFQDRKLALTGDQIGAVFSSLSAASVELTGTSRNGWRDWYLRLPGQESWILADDWRSQKPK